MQRWVLGIAMVVLFCGGRDVSASAQTQGQQGIETTAERLVDLNQATAVELETLPGIGERTAARIIAYRQAHEGFEKVEELMNMQGIGERTFLRLRPFIMLTAARPSAAGAQRSGNGR